MSQTLKVGPDRLTRTRERRRRVAEVDLAYVDSFLDSYNIYGDMSLDTCDGRIGYMIDHDTDLKAEIIKALKLKRAKLLKIRDEVRI